MVISNAHKIFNLLNELNAVFHKSLQKYYSKLSLTTSQIIVLTLLDQFGEMKISELASRTGFPDSNISGVVDRLENGGFVERVRCSKDRRVVRVRLTEKASELKKDFDLNIEEYFKIMSSHIAQQDLDEIVKSLEKLKTLISQVCPTAESV